MKKYLAKALGLTLALSTVMAVPAQAAFVIEDLDGDGYVNKYDAMIALQGAVQDPLAADFTAKDRYGADLESPVITAHADVDRDGKITANDAALYMNQSLVVNFSMTNGSKTESYKISALKTDKVLDLYEALFDSEDPEFENLFEEYITKVQNKVANTTITFQGEKYSAFDEKGYEKVAEEINSIEGYEKKLDVAMFKALMPKNKEAINRDYVRNFPNRLVACFAADVRDNPDYAKAVADKLRNYSTTKGSHAIKLEYVDANGNKKYEEDARSVAADLIEQFGYTSVTVGDIASKYGNKASLQYNSYTAIIEVTNG